MVSQRYSPHSNTNFKKEFIMPTLVALNSQTHQTLGINTKHVESQAGLLHMVPVVLSEFLRLSLQYPIVFTKNKDTGRFTCTTLFGLEKGENLFFNNDAWDALYLPLQVRRQPFFIGESEGEDDKSVICIDMNHSSINTESGEKLFDMQGNETNYLINIKNILAELFDGEKTTQAFINQLLSLNLLQPMQLQITLEDDYAVRVDGLYTVNEAALNKLTAEQLFTLHEKNHLHPIYTMITSIGHIYGLVDKKNKRLATCNRE
jgi:hypothetical protein